MRRRDLLVAPVLEAALILVAALCAILTQKPLIFASLGPTAYELVETPERPSARPYNIFVGHLIAVLAGFAALYLTHAWNTPVVSLGQVAWARVWAATVAAGLTVFLTLLARATQPAAVSTTLLVALGVLQRPREGVIIMAAVTLMLLVGEPLRRWREKDMNRSAG